MQVRCSVGRRLAATFGAAVLALCGTSALGGDAPNLLANGSFDAGSAGWAPGEPTKGIDFDWLKSEGRRESGCLHVRAVADAADGPWIWFGKVESVPADSALRISGWIRGKGVAKCAAICVQGWSADGTEQVGFATTQESKTLTGDFDWTLVQADLPATPKLAHLSVLAFVAGPGEAWFDDLRVERTSEKPKSDGSAGLVLAQGRFDVVAGEDTDKPLLLIPLPLSYREQAPVSFELRTEPDGGLAHARVYEDSPGNWVVEATLRAMKAGATIHVSWSSLVLCGERSFADLPEKATVPAKWPDEASPWLRSTRCVQSADPRFVAIAAELRRGTDDVREIVRRVVARAGDAYRGAKGNVTELTALEALDKQGSCTSNANLVAALLRASGVPARILSGYPLWSGPLQTHYIVEAYVPGYGWYPIESSALREAWQPYQQVEVSIVSTAHEDAALPRRCGAGGVPYLSLTEIAGERWWNVGTIEGAPGCDHVAELRRPLATKDAAADWTSALDGARKRWNEWLSHAKLGANGRVATDLQPDAVKATTAAELARQLGR